MDNINLETVCFIIVKAREFDAKVEPVEPDPGSNPADDGMREVLEDYGDDPVMQEITETIAALNIDQQAELVALAWLGRGDFTADDWPEALRAARQRHSRHTAGYLLGMPVLADYLEEGLSAFGLTCEDVERDHL